LHAKAAPRHRSGRRWSSVLILALLLVNMNRGVLLNGHAQSVQQPGYRAVKGSGERQLDPSLRTEMLVYGGVDLVGDAPFDEGVGEGKGGALRVVESRGGTPHRHLRDPMLIHASFRGHKAVLMPLVL